MLEEAFELPEEDDFITVPEGVTEEQLIEEAKQYVAAIIVTHHKKKDSPSVFLKTGDSDEVKAESDSDPKDGDKFDQDLFIRPLIAAGVGQCAVEADVIDFPVDAENAIKVLKKYQ